MGNTPADQGIAAARRDDEERARANPTAFDFLRQELDEQAARDEKLLAKWGNGFSDDPHYALKWSGDAFEAASRVRVYRRLAEWAKERGPEMLDRAIHEMTQEAIRAAARGVLNSTSPTSNLTDQSDAKASVHALELLRRYAYSMRREAFVAANPAKLEWVVAEQNHYRAVVDGVGTYDVYRRSKGSRFWDVTLTDADGLKRIAGDFTESPAAMAHAAGHSVNARFLKLEGDR